MVRGEIVNILDNELVRKYFREGPCLGEPNKFNGDCKHKNCVALRVLNAMQEPVKEGEQYCAISAYREVSGPHRFTSSDQWKFHCQWLRLPDRFQETEKKELCEDKMKCECHSCTQARAGHPFGSFGYRPPPSPEKCDHIGKHLGQLCQEYKPDPVEEKIEEFIQWANSPLTPVWKEKLRELVDLARKC